MAAGAGVAKGILRNATVLRYVSAGMVAASESWLGDCPLQPSTCVCPASPRGYFWLPHNLVVFEWSEFPRGSILRGSETLRSFFQTDFGSHFCCILVKVRLSWIQSEC